MASVSIEFSAFLDPRFRVLAKLSGLTRFDAVGRMAAIWVHTIEKNNPVLNRDVVDALSEMDGYSQLAIQADLMESLDDGSVRIKGTEGRIEYLERCRQNSPKGGTTRAKGAKRDEKGRFVPPQPSSHVAGDHPAGRVDFVQPGGPAKSSPSSSTSSSASTLKENTIVQRKRRTSYTSEFEKLYNQYPRREGKAGGYRTYLSTIKTDEDRAKLELAIRNYSEICKREGREFQYIKQFSSFMSNWTDYQDPSSIAVSKQKRTLTFGDSG